MQEKTINKSVIDYISKLNLSYDKEKDTLYLNNVECNEYIIRVILNQVERHTSQNIEIDTIIIKFGYI